MSSDGESQEEEGPADGEELPKEIKREFVVQVILLNIALFALGLGVMLLYFRRDLQMGGGLVLIGLFSLLATWRRYKLRAPSA